MRQLSLSEMSTIDGGSKLGCALAIGGTLCVTIGAIWVTGGAALYVFLASKGIATAAVIEACTNM